MPPWEWRKRKLVVATARTSQRLSSHRPDFPCASRPLLRSSTQPTPFFCYECSSTVAALSCRTWFDRFLPPFFKPSPTRGSHTRYPLHEVGGSQGSSPSNTAETSQCRSTYGIVFFLLMNHRSIEWGSEVPPLFIMALLPRFPSGLAGFPVETTRTLSVAMRPVQSSVLSIPASRGFYSQPTATWRDSV